MNYTWKNRIIYAILGIVIITTSIIIMNALEFMSNPIGYTIAFLR